MKIRRNSPIPLYLQIKSFIKHNILSGKWKPDTLIPSQRKLCQKFKVSPITVKLAIKELINDGLLYQIHGKGTFVNDIEKTEKKNKERYNYIGLVLYGVDFSYFDEASYPYFYSIFKAISQKIAQQHYDIVVMPRLGRNLTGEDLNLSIDGLILVNPRARNIKDIQEIEKRGIPFISIYRCKDEDTNYIEINIEKSTYEVTKQLLNSGYSYIGYITPKITYKFYRTALRGYLKALREASSCINKRLIQVMPSTSEENGYSAAISLLNHNDLQAIIILDDKMTQGCINAIKKKKKKITIVGTEYLGFPSISSDEAHIIIQIPFSRLGEIAGEKILEIIKDSISIKMELESKIVVNKGLNKFKGG